MKDVGKNWFLDEFEATNVIVDCECLGVKHEDVAFSITNYYLHGLLDRKVHDYYIISDNKEFYGKLCEEEKIIWLAELDAFLSVLEKRSAKEEKAVFVFIDELSDLLAVERSTLGKIGMFYECARDFGLRFIIFNSVMDRSILLSWFREFCDGHYISHTVSGEKRLYIVDEEVFALDYVLKKSTVTVNEMQKALLICVKDVAKHLDLCEAHGIVKKSDDNSVFSVLVNDLRTAYGMLKTDKTEG